jgi:sugar phosphate isomerase/epimerase
MEMIQTAHFDDVGICFDFGHAHIMGTVGQAFEIVRQRVCSTHVHDNARLQDSHLWPGQGTIDWKQAMELLRSAPQTPPLMLELAEDEKVHPMEKFEATFDQLEGA